MAKKVSFTLSAYFDLNGRTSVKFWYSFLIFIFNWLLKISKMAFISAPYMRVLRLQKSPRSIIRPMAKAAEETTRTHLSSYTQD